MNLRRENSIGGLESVSSNGQGSNLSIAIVHLLSMKSVALSKVAGHASAATRLPRTVYIAPRDIS